MVIVSFDDPNREKTLKYLKHCKKKVGVVEIVGYVHEGHKNIIKEAKKFCDILCVEYLEFWRYETNYLKSETRSTSSLLSDFMKDFAGPLKDIEEYIDYVFYSKSTDDILKQTNYIKENYLENFIKLHNDLGIPSIASDSAGYHIHDDVVDACTDVFAGPRCIIQNLTMRKVIPPDKLSYKPQIIGKFTRKESGETIARSSSSKTIGLMIREIYKEILKGGSGENLLEVYKGYFLGDFLRKPEFSIIDLDKVEKISTISNNCVIVLGDTSIYEFMIIENGDIMF